MLLGRFEIDFSAFGFLRPRIHGSCLLHPLQCYLPTPYLTPYHPVTYFTSPAYDDNPRV